MTPSTHARRAMISDRCWLTFSEGVIVIVTLLRAEILLARATPQHAPTVTRWTSYFFFHHNLLCSFRALGDEPINHEKMPTQLDQWGERTRWAHKDGAHKMIQPSLDHASTDNTRVLVAHVMNTREQAAHRAKVLAAGTALLHSFPAQWWCVARQPPPRWTGVLAEGRWGRAFGSGPLDQYPFFIGDREWFRTHYEQPTLDDPSEFRGPQAWTCIDVLSQLLLFLGVCVPAVETYAEASGQLSMTGCMASMAGAGSSIYHCFDPTPLTYNFLISQFLVPQTTCQRLFWRWDHDGIPLHRHLAFTKSPYVEIFGTFKPAILTSRLLFSTCLAIAFLNHRLTAMPMIMTKKKTKNQVSHRTEIITNRKNYLAN